MPARPEGEFDFKKCLRNANGYERHAGTGQVWKEQFTSHEVSVSHSVTF